MKLHPNSSGRIARTLQVRAEGLGMQTNCGKHVCPDMLTCISNALRQQAHLHMRARAYKYELRQPPPGRKTVRFYEPDIMAIEHAPRHRECATGGRAGVWIYASVCRPTGARCLCVIDCAIIDTIMRIICVCGNRVLAHGRYDQDSGIIASNLGTG